MISRIQASCFPKLLKTSTNSHLYLQNQGDLPKIYNGVFKWVYLWRCGQGWGSEEKQHYKKPSLSCFNKEESSSLPSLQTHAFPIMCSMEVTGGTVSMGRLKPKVWPLRKIKLNLTSKADGQMMIRKRICISKLHFISITV